MGVLQCLWSEGSLIGKTDAENRLRSLFKLKVTANFL